MIAAAIAVNTELSKRFYDKLQTRKLTQDEVVDEKTVVKEANVKIRDGPNTGKTRISAFELNSRGDNLVITSISRRLNHLNCDVIYNIKF